MMNGNTQRGTARILKCSRHTVEKKLLWLKKHHAKEKFIFSQHLQIDAMETIEHTKLKPLTIPICVDADYKIVATEIGRINAKGHLAAISLKKYGPRPNELESSLRNLLLKLKTRAPHPLTITTDSHPLYPKLIKEFFPLSEHIQVSSRDKLQKHRELIYSSQRKKIFDPMFALNQRCAMLRADLRRLTRRSWCTTKNIENLKSQLELYAIFNNQKLQPT